MKRTAMDDQTSRTEYVDVEGGRIAYEVIGQGPLVVLSPGMADTRSSYRFLAPLIADAGYRVASVDLRGHGESSTGWGSYNLTQIRRRSDGGHPEAGRPRGDRWPVFFRRSCDDRGR